MRADRLLSLLMLLQAHGRLTAGELAKRLEVSERTVYRDADALSAAGVPIYAERGPDGGFALLDNYRTDLTGLTEAELRSLFLLSIPSGAADLGLDDAMAAALRKLSAAATGLRRGEEARVRGRFYLDPGPWRDAPTAVPHLRELQQAAWEDRRADVAYRLPSGPVVEQRLDVYGLVAKEGLWHVVYLRDGRVLALRVSDLAAVELTEEHFVRRPGFDLVEAWRQWCAGRTGRPRYEMTLKVAAPLVSRLGQNGIACVSEAEMPAGASGTVLVEASCESFEVARERILALGGAVEVVGPEPLRRSVLDYAEQIVARYRGGEAAGL